RGAYGAVATAPSTARPGLILDSLEQMVLMAEESRVRSKEGLRPAPERETPSADTPRRMRTTLHRERAPAPASGEEKLSPEAQEVAVSAWARRLMRDRAESESGPASAEGPEEISLNPSTEAEAEASDAPVVEDEGETRPSRDDSLVDRVELSREFAGILAEHEEDEE
ncbi:MAG TPA: hypothetical protein VGR13_07710, partial [Actinomycetota bacterium]|nr:hypothetical protein [Actinomycetota bacterium]